MVPDHTLLCVEPFSIDVTVSCTLGPATGAVVWVEYVDVSGEVSLPPHSEVVVDNNGYAQLEFPDGISGNGSLRLQVWADGIDLFTSDLYSVVADCAVARQPRTWGGLKAVYSSASGSP